MSSWEMCKMVSGVSSIGSVGSSGSGVQPLSPQTKAQLDLLGVNTSNIKTEAQGQTALQSAQSSQASQSAQQSQQSQQPQQTQGAHKAGGGNQAFESLKSEAMQLASKVGASVSQNDKLDAIMSAISTALTNMQAQAVNNPQKAARIKGYQVEFQSLSTSLSSMQSSSHQQAAQSQVASTQIQNSLNAMALYNMASVSISNSNPGGVMKN